MNSQTIEKGFDIQKGEAIDHIEAYLQSLLNGRVRNLRLRMDQGRLILQGRAHTYYSKQIAQHAVMQATRLQISRNEIEVC